MPDFITAKAAKNGLTHRLRFIFSSPSIHFLAHATQHPFEMKKRLSTVAVHLNLGFHAAILLSFYKLF